MFDYFTLHYCDLLVGRLVLFIGLLVLSLDLCNFFVQRVNCLFLFLFCSLHARRLVFEVCLCQLSVLFLGLGLENLLIQLRHSLILRLDGFFCLQSLVQQFSVMSSHYFCLLVLLILLFVKLFQLKSELFQDPVLFQDDWLLGQCLCVFDLLLEACNLLLFLLLLLLSIVYFAGLFVNLVFKVCNLVHFIVGHPDGTSDALGVLPDLCYFLAALFKGLDFLFVGGFKGIVFLGVFLLERAQFLADYFLKEKFELAF